MTDDIRENSRIRVGLVEPVVFVEVIIVDVLECSSSLFHQPLVRLGDVEGHGSQLLVCSRGRCDTRGQFHSIVRILTKVTIQTKEIAHILRYCKELL